MTTQGDAILKKMIADDIERLERCGADSPCAHCGMLTLLRCQQALLDGADPIGRGAVAGISSGVVALGLGLMELVKYFAGK
jgi:hypothetical protein